MVPRTKAELHECLQDKAWRKNNLYTIVDESGLKVPYRQRAVQAEFAGSRTYCDVILKSRQHGFTSECCIDMLDDCIFTPDLKCGVIAHTKLDAQAIFSTKIRTPYEELPALVKELCPVVSMTTQSVVFANGSEIRVAVSFRSATTHRLHISEYGKICAKYPVRAEEIRTGSIPSVHPQMGGKITIESTAEGAAGDFYDLCTQSQADTAQADKEGRELNRLQYRFHFYAWHQDPKNRIEPLGIKISDALVGYFENLSEKGIALDIEQQSWYAQKKDGAGGLGRAMKREHPSTVDEAFEAAVQGAVYADEMDEARSDGRIGFYPWIKNAPVYTFWDLGYRNSTCVGFVQFIKEQVRVIDYYTARGRGAAYHAAQVNAKPYDYREHHMPHDIMCHEKGSGIILKDTYQNLFKAPIQTVTRPKLKRDSLDALSDTFPLICFNAKTCASGRNEENLIKSLGWYRYEWDADHAVWSKVPVGDWAADPADMMQTLALQHRYGQIDGEHIGYPYAIPRNVHDDNEYNVGEGKAYNPFVGMSRRA